MPTDVVSKIGATNSPTTMDYSTLQAWEDACSPDLTTSRSNTTITGATSSTIILDAGASGTTDFYKGHPVWADARPSEKRMITAYNGTTKIATIGAFNGSNATWDNIPTIEAYTVDSIRYIGECYDQGKFTAGFTISGQTVDATRYIILRCAPGHSFKDKAGVRSSPLRYDSTTGSGVAFEYASDQTCIVSTQYTQVDGIQINNTSYPVSMSANGANITVSNCIFTRSGSAGNLVNVGQTSTKLIDCLLQYQFSSGNASVLIGQLLNCTVINVGGTAGTSAAVQSDYNAGHAKNTAFFGFFDNTSGSTTLNAASDYNATDLSAIDTAIGGGTHNVLSLTFASQFESTTNDSRSKTTGGLQAGTPDPTNAPLDISTFTRDATTPYIGCWEASAGVPPVPAAPISLRHGQSVRRSAFY